MPSARRLLEALDERLIAREVGLRHDNARLQFRLAGNTVADDDEFKNVIATYYNHHISEAMGVRPLPWWEAWARGRRILDQEYRRKGSDIVGALNDAMDGIGGGLKSALDAISEALKKEGVELYVQSVFDRHVGLHDFESQVAMIRSFFDHCGAYLASSIQLDRPERYAGRWQELIRAYVDGLQRTGALYRRM